jgi:hypothetical protein
MTESAQWLAAQWIAAAELCDVADKTFYGITPEYRCGDCGAELHCQGCARTLSEDECPVLPPENGPNMYCANCEPEIHDSSVERAVDRERFEALQRQSDIDEGYNPYAD